MQRDTSSTKFPLGSKLPKFELLNVDGKKISDSYLRGGNLALVVFSCNHCPYVKGSEEQLVSLATKFEPQGLKTVVINSNDAVQYPEDSFENMKTKAASMLLPYPYLYDETQSVAKSFDAACTPEAYLFDAEMALVFHGTINDNPRDKTQAKHEFLSEAIIQALKGETLSPAFVHPIGCSIKWRN